MVALVERESLLENLCQVAVGSINKVLNNASDNTGDKSKQKKTRRGKINVSKDPITTIKDQPEPATFDFGIDLSKGKLLTEEYQNNDKSEILFLNNP